MTQVDQEEWTVIKPRRRRVTGSSKKPIQNLDSIADKKKFIYKQSEKECSTTSTDKLLQNEISNINSIMEKMRKTSFCSKLFKTIESSILQSVESSCIDIVVYGIGSPSKSSNSAYQLATLLLIQEYFKSQKSLGSVLDLFEPVLNPLDISLISSFDAGITILTLNEMAYRRITKNPTLFYMPHAPRVLYENVLRSNSASRQRIFIIGNSFEGYDTSVVDAEARSSSLVLSTKCTEISLFDLPACKSDFKSAILKRNEYLCYREAFNDTSLHSEFNFTCIESDLEKLTL